MTDRREHTGHLTRRVTLGEFVRREIPHLRISSMSQPEPELARHNVLATTRDIEAARSAVLDLEALEANDAKLGLVVLSKASAYDLNARLTDAGADPEGVTGMVASRTLTGGALGALAGALLIGGVTALLGNGSATTAVVAAIGGAFIGGVFGAIMVVFARMGGSDAYRQSFIAPELTDVCIVSLHTNDPEEAASGRDRLAARNWLTVVDVDVDGSTQFVHPKS